MQDWLCPLYHQHCQDAAAQIVYLQRFDIVKYDKGFSRQKNVTIITTSLELKPPKIYKKTNLFNKKDQISC